MLRSTVESAQRARVDGHKRVRGSKVHAVVDILGAHRLLSLVFRQIRTYPPEAVRVVWNGWAAPDKTA
jgi:hypothetical protein